ncbi:Predicted seven transmembrane receptor-rhodopsin family [Plasmopara halstedii]|uniref:Predicted seven transmembrane receptor-rhodopsin family n=1 Tax=Plasmopara halstedii TaxID=4781 RepID=A0A0P1AZE2_PLAHL|nr:Predicted seven transmembrane receptor-rhodopsin family [Plasmopara halstedii]CEG47806.1 Predicted seven transmembrane receptor-rhodopsin family [Plasmopara halstedii]|eukprot:XP_024584175.1 Predicted seven transmembrane receptor-rhodopsin family [Plasmopara halstedii]
MDTPVHEINESSLLLGNATGNAQVLGLSLNWVETHRASSLFIAFGCCVVATLLSVYNIVQHLAHYSRPQLQRYIVRILVVVPVYAIGSLLSLTFVNQALYFDSIRDCYEAFVVYSFLALVLSFAGGESVCVLKMQSESDIRHPWPLNRCFYPLGRDGRLLRLCKRATIQYHTLAYQFVLAVVYNFSYSMALYGMYLFYLATRHILQPFNPVLKFFAVKSVVFLTFWQNSFLDLIPGITNEQTFAWKDFILCIEMVLFALLHLLAFNSSQFKKNLDRLPDSEVLNNMKEVLSLSDILADAYHNFMPSYREYMLQRPGGESGGSARKGQNSTGLGDISFSEDSPTLLTHNNARAPRFVIDDEDDDFDEIDLESNAIAVSAEEAATCTKKRLQELRLPGWNEVTCSHTDVRMANPQDDDHNKTLEIKDVACDEIDIHQQPEISLNVTAVEASGRPRFDNSPRAVTAHECTQLGEESATL